MIKKETEISKQIDAEKRRHRDTVNEFLARMPFHRVSVSQIRRVTPSPCPRFMT